MRVGIIGVGPVGLTIAVKMGLAGHEVHLHSNDSHQMEDIRENEVDLGGTFDDRFTFEHVHDDLKSFLAQRFEFICIAIKTPYLKGLLKDMWDLGLREVPVVSCQNGIGTGDEIAEVFGDAYAYRMVINYAGNSLSPSVVKIHFFHGPNFLSSLSPSGFTTAKMITDALTKAELDTEFTPRIKDHVFKKVILNCSLSGICALTRMTMQQAMSDSDLREMVKHLLLEGIEIAHLEGMNLGDGYMQSSLDYLGNAGNHKPSMLIDIESGCPTEMDYLNHKILQLARKHNIHTPFSHAITALTRALDKTVQKNKEKELKPIPVVPDET